MKIKFSRLTTAILILFAASTLAQAPVEQVSPTQAPASVAQPTPDAMSKMSEMCQEMMQKEKAAMPYIAGAAVSLGVLLLIALILFVILEVQWIIYWKRILKAQKTVGSGQ